MSEVLTHFNPSLPIQLTYKVGAVISHVLPDGEEKPSAFTSRTLKKAEINYAQLEPEELSIVLGVRKFHQYMYRRKFTVLPKSIGQNNHHGHGQGIDVVCPHL